MSRPSRSRTSSITTTCCSTGRRPWATPALADEIGGKWDHVLVDEYQDTNRLQATILTGLKPAGRGLTVVGDDAQSIYSFRAATVRNILDFPKEFSPPAEVITLDRNYRSTQPILAAANAVIGAGEGALHQEPLDRPASNERPRLVTVRARSRPGKIRRRRGAGEPRGGMRLKDQAVLFRASHHSGPLEVELTRRNIPFVKFGGLKFLDSAHVKDMLAAAALRPEHARPRRRLPRDAAAAGRRPCHGADRARCRCRQRRSDRHARPPPLPRPRAADWPGFVELLAGLRSGMAGWPAEIGQARLVRAASRTHPRGFRDAPADLLQLEDIAAGYPIARTLPHRTDPRSSRRHVSDRPACRCSTRTI
jgi:DNA helicase-2/ATP-dependent DNA helicase PcrA